MGAGEASRDSRRHRTTRIDGLGATAWFSARGWTLGESTQQCTVFADEFEASGVMLRRVWHTACRLSRSHTVEDLRVHVLLQVSGTLVLDMYNGQQVAMTAGSLYVGPRGSILRARAKNATARIEVTLPAEFSLDDHAQSPGFFSRHNLGTAMLWNVLCSLVNSVLNAPTRLSVESSKELGSSVVHLVSALGIDCARLRLRNALHADVYESLYGRACALLARRAPTIGYSVEDLATELGVTMRHLGRVFQTHGTSPGKALREQRTAAARALMNGSSNLSPSQIARLAGFSSTRTLKDALTVR